MLAALSLIEFGLSAKTGPPSPHKLVTKTANTHTCKLTTKTVIGKHSFACCVGHLYLIIAARLSRRPEARSASNSASGDLYLEGHGWWPIPDAA